MRQFFSWRIWAALAALVGLALLWRAVMPAGGVTAHGPPGPTARTVQFVSLVYLVRPSVGFSVERGVVAGSADFVLDGQRTMHVLPGTLGEITCTDDTLIGRCAVLADLLGDAVVWFALVPVEPGLKVAAPPIVELLDNNVARLTNGWLVPYDSTVDRDCGELDSTSLRDFVHRFGPHSTSIIDVARQRITQVVCASSGTATTGT